MQQLKNWRIWLALSPLVPALALPGGGALISFLIVFLAIGFVKEARVATLRMLSGGWGRTLALGIGGGLAITAASWAIEYAIVHIFGLQLDLSSFDNVEGNFKAYLVLLAIGIGIGGVLEELTFRGFVVGWGAKILGERSALWLVLLSALVFGLTHLYQSWGGAISTGLAGAMLGFLYLYADRKVLVPMLAHATINIVGITAIYYGVSV